MSESEETVSLKFENKKTYSMIAICINCRNRKAYDIPYGMSASRFFAPGERVCHICGCSEGYAPV